MQAIKMKSSTEELTSKEKATEVENIAKVLLDCMNEYCPNNQQRTMAKKKLRTALFWAKKSIEN